MSSGWLYGVAGLYGAGDDDCDLWLKGRRLDAVDADLYRWGAKDQTWMRKRRMKGECEWLTGGRCSTSKMRVRAWMQVACVGEKGV